MGGQGPHYRPLVRTRPRKNGAGTRAVTTSGGYAIGKGP